MDFDLNESQSLLQDGLRRLLAGKFGLLGLPFAEQMGRHITLEPWFSTVVLGGVFLVPPGEGVTVRGFHLRALADMGGPVRAA